MYVCVCAKVRESELWAAIAAGARDTDDIADRCGAGTGCGCCLSRVTAMLGEPARANPGALAA